MIPIQDLLNRIRLDDAFATGYFVIGYHDRISGGNRPGSAAGCRSRSGNHFFFQFTGPNGTVREVPLHRIREVYKNGELIWHRDR